MLKIFCIVLILAVVGLPVSPVGAVEVPSLYTTEVPLQQRGRDPRARAYELALADILLRVSGSELADNKAMIASLFPDPAAYVLRFRPGDKDTLWVSFDGAAIEKVLRQSGQRVWGADRPLTLIWLAVDRGQGKREIISADDPSRGRDGARSIDRNRLLRQRVLDIAERRGVPVAFPLLDTVDLQNVSSSDIWGGFDDAVVAASARYDANSILIGRIQASSSQRNRWSYHFGGEERSWNGEPEKVIGLVGDMLAAEFAIGSNASRESIELTIAGIDSVEAFGDAQSILAGLSLIESYSIIRVDGDQIRYRVEALGGVEQLRRALRFSGLIEQNGFDGDRLGAGALGETLDFFYSR